MLKENPIRVYCPVQGKEETVYINEFEHQDVRIPPRFNGCDSAYHACPACENCGDMAMKMFSRQSEGGSTE